MLGEIYGSFWNIAHIENSITEGRYRALTLCRRVGRTLRAAVHVHRYGSGVVQTGLGRAESRPRGCILLIVKIRGTTGAFQSRLVLLFGFLELAHRESGT